MKNHSVIDMISRSKCIPQIPKAFGEALNMLLEPCAYIIDECIERLSDIPNLEPALIKVLNYKSKLSREILTLKDAVLYLGAVNVRLIAIAFITNMLLPKSCGRAKIFNHRTYWKHCIGTSITCSMIAEETGLCDKEKIFIYGLIHDIGVTVLDICLPDCLDTIFTMQTERGLHQIVAEKIVLNGVTHEDIGLWLCEEWGLPDEIKEVVAYHHAPLKSSRNEVKIMYMGDAVSTDYYEKLLGTERSFVYSDKILEYLNLSREFIGELSRNLPEEVEKVIRIMEYDLDAF